MNRIEQKTVLVTGAASGVGFYAAQMARLKGARVIGTVGSQEKAKPLAAAGIDEVIYYKTEAVAQRLGQMTDGAGVDGVVDLDFSTTSRLVPAGAVARHGVFVCYGSNDRGDVPVEFSSWMPRSISLVFFLVYDLLPAERRHAVQSLNALLAGGKLAHLLAPAYPLAEIVAAHQAVESGKLLGNVVVSMPQA